MNKYSKIDRPFFDKFNNSTFFKNENELHNSILTEIANILSANIRIKGNTSELPTTDYNPYAYGTRDLQSLSDVSKIRNEFIEHCKQQLLALEPRIKNCEILNVSLDYMRHFLNFDLTYIIADADELFSATVTLKV